MGTGDSGYCRKCDDGPKYESSVSASDAAAKAYEPGFLSDDVAGKGFYESGSSDEKEDQMYATIQQLAASYTDPTKLLDPENEDKKKDGQEQQDMYHQTMDQMINTSNRPERSPTWDPATQAPIVNRNQKGSGGLEGKTWDRSTQSFVPAKKKRTFSQTSWFDFV